MTPSRRFKALRRLGRKIPSALAKVPRALKIVRSGVKRRPRAAVLVVASMYEITHLVNHFRPGYNSEDHTLNSLTLSASTTITLASELSSPTTLDDVELEAECIASDETVKPLNIKILGTGDEFTTSVQPATIAVDKDVSVDRRNLGNLTVAVSFGEDGDEYEQLLARVSTMDKDERHIFDTNQLAMGKKRSAELSVTVEPVEGEGKGKGEAEAAEDETLTVDDVAAADEGLERHRSIQRAKATHQELRAIRASRRHPSDSKNLSLSLTPYVNTPAIHRYVVKERDRARSRASALSLLHLREDTPFCFANCDLVHDRPAVLAVLGRSSPLCNSFVKEDDEDEYDEDEALESMSTGSWSEMWDDEELEPLEDLVTWRACSR